MKRRTFLQASAAATAATVTSSFPLTASALSNAPLPKLFKNIQGNDMAYVDQGAGRPIVFLHGNPTSSYIWRNIIPYVTDSHRAIAPDMIGMGDSAKPDIDYTYDDHAAHLHGLLDAFDLRDAVLVIQDWGSGLGWQYARTRPERVSAIAFMEAMVPPFHPIPSYQALGPFEDFLKGIRTEGVGEEMILNKNIFIDEFLAKGGVVTPLSEEVMAEYRRPFPTPKSRKPVLQWPREIPIGGEPASVHKIVAANSEFVLSSDIPKLAIYGTPGAMMGKQVIDFVAERATNLETVDVGAAGHFIQEDQPDAIGRALAEWLTRV